MTTNSLTASRRRCDLIDQAFAWTASSLAVMAIAGALTAAAHWPAAASARTRGASRAVAAARRTRAGPAAFISFALPVMGYPIISPFGLRQLPWEAAGRLHKGVDIAAPEGQPVLAAADGMVLRTDVDPGYGRFIELIHAGGIVTLYGHLSAVAVRPGMAVHQGQPIGSIGSTGSSTGSHLHFEIHDPAGRPVNPEMLLGRSFLRLADLPFKAAERLPDRRVRIAYVSFIPPAKEAELLAREEAEAQASQARLPKPPPPAAAAAAAIAPISTPAGAPDAIAQILAEVQTSPTTAGDLHVTGPGPDGRVRGVIASADAGVRPQP